MSIDQAHPDPVSLSAALRALALDRGQSSGRGLWRLAEQIELGVPLDKAIGASRLPPLTRALLLISARSGRHLDVVDQLAAVEQGRWELRHRTLLLVYPAILLVSVFWIGVLAAWRIVPRFHDIFEEFGLELPALTQLVLFCSRWFGWACIGLTLAACLLALALLYPAGSAFRRIILERIPLLGRIWRWQAMAEYTRLLAVAIESNIGLPDALRLAADGIGYGRVRKGSRHLATRVEAGEPLAAAMAAVPVFPLRLRTYVSIGMQMARLPEALRAAGDSFALTGLGSLAVWVVILPPVLFAMIVGGVAIFVSSLLLPLVSLIQMLS